MKCTNGHGVSSRFVRGRNHAECLVNHVFYRRYILLGIHPRARVEHSMENGFSFRLQPIPHLTDNLLNLFSHELVVVEFVGLLWYINTRGGGGGTTVPPSPPSFQPRVDSTS